jgi:hypothetical protein
MHKEFTFALFEEKLGGGQYPTPTRALRAIGRARFSGDDKGRARRMVFKKFGCPRGYKAKFVKQQPFTMPPRGVVAAAARHGIDLTAQYVSNIRSSMRKGGMAADGGRKSGEGARKGSTKVEKPTQYQLACRVPSLLADFFSLDHKARVGLLNLLKTSESVGIDTCSVLREILSESGEVLRRK